MDLMENAHQPPVHAMIKERRLRRMMPAARRSDNIMVIQLRGYPGVCSLLDGPVALKRRWREGNVGRQMIHRSLEWSWPKEAVNIPIWAGVPRCPCPCGLRCPQLIS